ncbi:MAG: hypothetical protein JOZ69_10460, partial [Myxococcales bacterium]|nr:hypothetical protein [Myxococcales bacterium]
MVTPSIAAGLTHTCELLANGTVQCWGDNSFGELGQLSAGGPPRLAPVPVQGLSNVTVTAISGSEDLVCALLSDQTVECWGKGYGPNPVFISNQSGSKLSGVLGISASGASWTHACAVLQGGTVSCWGDNEWGQLGNGQHDPDDAGLGSGQGSTIAVPVTGLSGVSQVVAHGHGTCALLSNGTVQCWGANNSGELGVGTIATACPPPYGLPPENWFCSLVPAAPIPGLNNVTALAAGPGDFICALQNGGTVSCWGQNNLGELGDGTTTDRLTPVPVTGLNGSATAIAAGTDHVCALVSGAVECWGSNGSGQLGNGSTANGWPTPVNVVGVGGATSVSAGGSHSCALLGDGSVACWGQNTDGQLGDGTQVSSPVPQGPTPGTNPIQVAAGWGQTCALFPNGTVQCWGDDSDAELGIGKYSSSPYPIPVTVPLPGAATAISGDSVLMCSLMADQTVMCWGDGWQGTPVKISNVSGAVGISASGSSWNHACAVLSTGTVMCWGDNTWGQLGNGTSTPSLGGGNHATTAVPVSGLSNV